MEQTDRQTDRWTDTRCFMLTTVDTAIVTNGNENSIHHNIHTNILRPSWILSRTTQMSRHQKGKTNLDSLEQEKVSGSGISWAICKSAHWPRYITMPASHHSVFTGHMPFLPPNQQRQSTEGNSPTTSGRGNKYIYKEWHWLALLIWQQERHKSVLIFLQIPSSSGTWLWKWHAWVRL